MVEYVKKWEDVGGIYCVVVMMVKEFKIVEVYIDFIMEVKVKF